MRTLLSRLSRATPSSAGSSLREGFLFPAPQKQQTFPSLDATCLRCRRQQLQYSHHQRQQRNFRANSKRSYQQQQHQQPADDPQWVSPIDRPSQIVRVGRRHGPGLIILGTFKFSELEIGYR